MGRVSRLSRFTAPSKTDIKAISYAMDVMDVARYSETPFNNLSGGEKQRVMLAMALAQEPEILLLDEPTSHLDIGHSSQLMKILSELNKGKNLTILLISHDINIAARYSSRVILMKAGRIMEDGDVRHVLEAGLIESAYDCKVRILDDGNGRKLIIPL
jgi:iron complex transport system ATP-binding protein